MHGQISHFFRFCHAKNTTQKLKKPCKKNVFDPHPIQKLYSLIYSKLFRVSKVMRYTANRFFSVTVVPFSCFLLMC